ncbi:MAG TPA: secretin N-terminal domain-containing protein [Vicinamibacterales bacterium]|nr:secretin N-terminal domain-containing protein [Vicinamibacterales bacterium]
MRHSHAAALLVVVALFAGGCAAGNAFRRGDEAARGGDWDAAVVHYREAVQADPQNPAYKIALERSMISASIGHLDKARLAEARGQLDEALREYRRASEYDPPNRAVAQKVLDLERTIRDQIEAAKRPSPQQMREAARAGAAPPLFNFSTIVQPMKFQQASLRDILNSIGEGTGINVTYESTYQDRVYTVAMSDVTLEQALQQITQANQLFYKVMNPKTIMIIPDTAPKRTQYEDQVVVTFPLSYGDPSEIMQSLQTVLRAAGQQLAPQFAPNKTNNSITVRGTTAMMGIVERLIDILDKPRAEIVIDVQILEVNKGRVRQYGLDLGSYSINAVFSPEADIRAVVTPPTNGDQNQDNATLSRAFNANTITRGISANDFYLAVPSAVIRFLETDSETKVIAKPQLRGAEGSDIRMNLGEDVPVPSTTFTPLAQGGANFNPLTSFEYRSVGVIVEMNPRVSLEGDIQMKLKLETSSIGPGTKIAGQELPSFNSRKVETDIRLREGESTLLAGLLQESERKVLSGLPWLLNLPIIKQLFSSNDEQIQQSDIVMLLTPRIVRTRELTPQDLAPVYIGTQSNFGLSGPPPLVAPVAGGPPVPDATPGTVAGPAPQTPAVTAQAPAPQTPAPPAGAPGTTAGAQPLGASKPGPATASAGQVLMSVPGPEFRLGGGPYLVPLSITGASQLSGITLTVSYNPAVLRLVNVQEGSFMRAGGVSASFSQQADPAGGRVDIAIVRRADPTGVAGTGLLAGLLFEAVASGAANLGVTGSATGPGGSAVNLQFVPVPAVRVP